ncbi:class I SAM-dependent methyltransferase [uncultured Desulfobacter sp.]|uniref:class I SAM-dependent methyltransferase n=1 Tax=uncultured Desulfobacter sp. TaxID=240139 RepID=UPI0029F495EC|nr:class I SAM-dependent methyltransferase [uncultured Desulfobacter sp.]
MINPKPYLDYVYDFEGRTFRNQFEEMYRECECPWPHQTESDNIQYKFVLECLRKSESLNILDLGCGLGYFSDMLRSLGKVTAVDISQTCINKAKNTFPNVRFNVADISAPLPLSSSDFDAVACLGVLWFVLPKIHQVLDEIYRILKPGGEAIFGLNIPENPIGKEVIETPQDFFDIVRSHFYIENLFSYYHLEGTTQLKDGDIAYYIHASRPRTTPGATTI